MPRASSAPLIGRADELAAGQAMLDAVHAGEPAALVVVGDAGVGKTRLVSELLAPGGAARVLVGHCVPLGDAPPPYLALAEAFARLPSNTATELAREFPPLAPLLGGAHERPAGEIARNTMLDTVFVALAQLAATQPTLLVIEDAHWADAGLRDLLGYLFTRLHDHAGLPLGVIVTVRSDDVDRRHPLRTALAAWWRLPAVRQMHLDPLPSTDMRALVQTRAADLDDRSVDEIVRRADGNAFFAEELTDSVERTSPGAGAATLPWALADLLLVRLDPLEPDARDLVAAVAVAGGSVGHELLERVVQLAPARFDTAARGALDANVLRLDSDVRGRSGYRFRHALLAEATYDDLLPGERRRLHAEFAAALANPATGVVVAAADLARHAIAADDLDTAYTASVTAARQATSVGSPGDALEQLQQALDLAARLPEPPADRADVVFDLVVACIAVGRSRRGLRIAGDELKHLPPGADHRDRAALLYAFAQAAAAGEFGEETSTAIAEALALIEGDPPSALAARLTALYARVTASLGRRTESVDSAARAVALADSAGSSHALLEARATQLMVQGRYGDNQRAVDELDGLAIAAAAEGDHAVAVRIRFSAATLVHSLGDLPRAQQAFDAGVVLARECGRPWDVYAVHSRAMSSRIRYARGLWDDALGVVAAIGDDAPPVARAILESSRIPVRAGRGDLDVLDEIARLRANWTDEGRIAVNSVFAAVPLLGHAGRVDDAIALADDFVAVISELWVDPWFLGRVELSGTVLELLTRTSAALPNAERAAAVVTGARFHDAAIESFERSRETDRRLGPEAVAWRTRVEAAWAALRWTAGLDAPDAAELLRLHDESVAANDYNGNVVELARSRAVLAVAQRAVGDSTNAAQNTAAALESAQRVGDVIVIDTLGEPDRTDTASHVTARERDVLDLVALGRSNKQIAQQLYISQKTVSVHVSNILAKLNARGRTEAVALARGRGLID